MQTSKIEPYKITKPIQLMAVWFVGLILLETTLLTAAAKIIEPSWITPFLVIAAIIFVPIFIVAVFLMQTVFRPQLQEDAYYHKWLKLQKKDFRSFEPENLNPTANKQIDKALVIDCESKRIKKYEIQQGLFIIHNWRPSNIPGQVADIVIWLHQHGEGPLSNGLVEKVEYCLGPKFFTGPVIKTNADEYFKLEISAYGPLLCTARVYIGGQKDVIELERYINFD